MRVLNYTHLITLATMYPLFKDRLYIEPQIHCNYWPIDTEGPQGFEEKEAKWNNYFLFEPNLFIGFNF